MNTGSKVGYWGEIVFVFAATVLGVMFLLKDTDESVRGMMTMFAVATFLRVMAMATINSFVAPEQANAHNNRYHRWVVIVLHALVGGSFVWYLVSHDGFVVLAGIIGALAVIYGLSRLWISPNSLWARKRSVLVVVTLFLAMSLQQWGLGWQSWVVAAACAAGYLIASWNLRKNCQKFGWGQR